MSTVYQNKWCRILLNGTTYTLQYKADKYNAAYFRTLEAALKYIGVTYKV